MPSPLHLPPYPLNETMPMLPNCTYVVAMHACTIGAPTADPSVSWLVIPIHFYVIRDCANTGILSPLTWIKLYPGHPCALSTMPHDSEAASLASRALSPLSF